MKRFFTQIFVGLGVIFLVIILVGMYFFITDPYELKPLIFGNSSTSTERRGDIQSDVSTTSDVGSGFELSVEQRQALAAFGIDPSSVPSTITSEQEACFIGVLGAARVTEIKGGAVPNALELMKAKVCIR